MRIEIGKEYKHISNEDIAEVFGVENKKVFFKINESKNVFTKILRNFTCSIKEFKENFKLVEEEITIKVKLESEQIKKLENLIDNSKPLFKLTKRLKDASIAHRLLDYKGKCENLHGHTYHFEINVWFDKQQNNGITMDFNSFKDIDRWIQDNWDHRTLVREDDKVLIDFLWEEDSMFYSMEGNSTVENMCKELRAVINEKGWLKDAVKYTIKIWETETSSCEL